MQSQQPTIFSGKALEDMKLFLISAAFGIALGVFFFVLAVFADGGFVSLRQAGT